MKFLIEIPDEIVRRLDALLVPKPKWPFKKKSILLTTKSDKQKHKVWAEAQAKYKAGRSRTAVIEQIIIDRLK